MAHSNKKNNDELCFKPMLCVNEKKFKKFEVDTKFHLFYCDKYST